MCLMSQSNLLENPKTTNLKELWSSNNLKEAPEERQLCEYMYINIYISH